MSNENSPYSLQRMIQFANSNFALLLIAGALFIGGFFSGSIWTENKILRSGQSGSAAAAQPVAQAPQGAATPNAPAAPTTATVDVGNLPLKGDKNAKIAIVEFADFRCPFCKRTFDDTLPQIEKDYISTGRVRLAFRNYQFLGVASVTAGNAAECANEQSKFWEFHDYLYKNQPSESDTSLYTSDKLTPIAQSLGMNGPQFKNCLDSNKYAQNVSGDQADGSKAGVTGTPSFVIGKVSSDGKVTGDLLVGAQPYTAFKTEIDKQLGQ